MPSGPAEDPEVVKAQIEKALADLDSDDADKIYPAITVVSKRKVLEATPKLIRILGQHTDVFTRAASAAALGELRACDAVPALAEALRDKTSMVAQQANKSLRLITDHDLGLSPQARAQERTRARADMLEFWQRHETELRERWKQPKGP
jgi:HEAT repeat protein